MAPRNRATNAPATSDRPRLSAGPEIRAPLVATKLIAPAAVSGQTERPRISALLDRGLEGSTLLTLLSAPPGYGKTVAVAGWFESRALGHAWLSLDVADNDLTRFVRYLVAALRAVRAEVGDATEGLVGPGISPSIDLLGASLLDEIAATDDEFVLVLDDYHVIGAEPIHRLVRFLIERGPPFAHLVLVTREDPPLPLARLRAHGRLIELRADDLRYTDPEASGYLAAALPAELDPEQLARLLERTEGWIAGLQLAAISLHDREDGGILINALGGSQRFVFDYLADEALGRVDEDLRSFLIKTAIPERFTVELCRELTGRDDAHVLLDRAERANLFLVQLDAEGHWYRYHRLSPTTSGPSSARMSDVGFTSARQTGSSVPVSPPRRSTAPLPPARLTARSASSNVRRGRRSSRGSWRPFSAGWRPYLPTGSR